MADIEVFLKRYVHAVAVMKLIAICLKLYLVYVLVNQDGIVCMWATYLSIRFLQAL